MALNNQGLLTPTYAERRQALATRLQGLAGGNVPTAEGTIEGDLITLLALSGQELAELLVAVHNAAYPRSANGAALDRAQTWYVGTRTRAAPSEVTLPLTGDPGTLIAAGKTAIPDGSDVAWVLDADVTLDGGGEGSGLFKASVNGPIAAIAGTTWARGTPVPGWATVGPNTLDAELGRFDESDESYRRRGKNALATGDLEAAVWGVDGVTLVNLIENPTDNPDAFWGLTHWAELLIVGGDDQAIGEALHRVRGPGRRLVGNTFADVVAPNMLPSGQVRLYFSRAVEVEVYVRITIVKGEKYPTSTGPEAVEAREALFKAAIMEWAASVLVPGQDLYGDAVRAAAFNAVPGVKSMGVLVDTSVPITASEVAIADREVAVLDTSRISVGGA
jgi:hypothetical protein